MRNLSSLSLVLLLLGCGATAPSSTGNGEPPAPGWKAISPAPPATLGTLILTQRGTTLEGELSTQEGDVPSGDLTVFVRWEGATAEQRIGSMRAADGERFRATFELPPCKGSAKGTLIVRSGDALVAVSNVDRGLFQFPYVATFQIESSCTVADATKKPLPPLHLTMDPRLPLALCVSKEVGLRRCGLDVLPEVRVASASATIAGDGSVLLSFSPVYVPPGEVAELTINGEHVESYAPGVWQARLASRHAPPLRPGDNEIVLSIGARPPWRARLELPHTDLRPRSGSLRVGQPFVVETEPAAWAHAYDVSMDAVVSPPLKSTLFFSSPTPRIEGTFDGFDHRARTTAPVSAARLVTTARGGGRGFELTQSEILEVPIL